jgi:hypothetical protein
MLCGAELMERKIGRVLDSKRAMRLLLLFDAKESMVL